MSRTKMLWTGVSVAVAAVAGSLTLSAGTASAADCEYGGDTSCVAVTYQVDWVKSIRVNGRCLIGGSGHYGSVVVGRFDTPDVQTYGGTKCESNTHNSARVRWGSEDSDGYRWVWITDNI